jgi:GNAT superfamily N-acetyltransferase
MLNKLSQLYASMGPLNAVLYVFARALAILTFGKARFVKYYIAAQPVPAGPFTPPRRGTSIQVTEGTAEQALKVPFGRPREVIEQRLAVGARYLLATKGDTLLGFQWFTLRDYPEDEVRCLFRLRPQDACAWDFDIYVRPDARIQPVFTRLWDACNDILRSAGIDYSLSRINAFNQLSMRAHTRLGARVVGWCTFFVAGPVQVSISSARPRVQASFSRKCAPVFAVSEMPARPPRKHTYFSD